MRIFFSYSSQDVKQAMLLVDALRSASRKAEVFCAPDTLRAGMFWTPALAEEIASAEACVVLVGEKAPGPWQLVEYYTAFDRASRDRAFPLVPVVLGASAEGFPFITLLHWISVAGLAGEGAAALILDALHGRPGERPSPWRYVNPFHDLQALDESAADLFFGRDEEITKAVEALAAATDTGVALIGNSGVGKSSLAYAGVFAALRRQRLPSGGAWPSALDHSREWLYVSFKPGEKPFEALVRAFTQTWQLDPTNAADKANEKDWVERIARGELSIGHLIDATQDRHTRLNAPKPSGVVVYMDQGEEIFALPKGEVLAFSQGLVAAVADPRLKLLLSLRSDHYGALQDDKPLFAALALVDVPPLDAADIEVMMSKSAAALGARFASEELPGRIARATADQPGALAVLSVYLAEMWRAMQARGDGVLSLAADEATIDIAGALRHRAERYLGENRAQEKVIRSLFVPGLVRVPKEGPPLRRRIAFDALDEVRKKIVADLASGDWRLLVTSHDGDTRTAEVAHEALFETWGRLRSWIELRRAFLEWKDFVEIKRKEWQAHGQRRDLLMGGELARAKEQLAENEQDIEKPEKTYIARSIRWRREKIAAGIMTVIAVMAVLSGALISANSARQELATANSALETTWEEVAEQLALAQRRESLFLAEKAKAAIERRQFTLATLIALEALPDADRDPDRPFVTEAAQVLGEAFADVARPIGEPMRHEGVVFSASFSPDGERIVTASHDSTARLWDAATGRPIGEPMRHEDGVISAAFSPDGERIVTASDSTARLWDAGTGGPIGEPMRHEDRVVKSVAFSPDGERIVTASDSIAQLWDTATGGPIGEPMRHEGAVSSTAFSPDGERIVTASGDSTARQWDAGTGGPIGEPMRHEDAVFSAAFSPDGERIVTAGRDSSARLWNAATGRPIGEPMRHQRWVTSAAFSPDGERIVTASEDGTARLWDAATGRPVGEPMRHEGGVSSTAFSPDGERIVTASRDSTARQWDAATGRPIGEPMLHEGSVISAAFSPDGERIVTASSDRTARLWDAPMGGPIGEPLRHEGAVSSAAFSPDGERIVTASNDSTARQWDVTTGGPIGEPMRHEGWVNSAAFAPGERIVTAGRDSTARLWDAATGRPIGEPMRHEGAVSSAAFSPDGERIVTASDDSTARLWDAATGGPIGEPMRHERGVSSAAFSPDGERIVTASEDGTARLWDAGTGGPIGEPMRHEGGVFSAAFSPDGKRIVTASDDRTARLWDAATGRPIGEPMRHERWVLSAAFSPDGERIVTTSFDSTARLWDAGTGGPIGEPMRHEGVVVSAAFSPDGERIVTAGRDSTARLWDAATGGPAGEPMRHEDGLTSAAFSPDGERIATASDDRTARLWQPFRGTPEDYIAHVRRSMVRCLTAEERKDLYLEPVTDIKANPDYCRPGAAR